MPRTFDSYLKESPPFPSHGDAKAFAPLKNVERKDYPVWNSKYEEQVLFLKKTFKKQLVKQKKAKYLGGGASKEVYLAPVRAQLFSPEQKKLLNKYGVVPKDGKYKTVFKLIDPESDYPGQLESEYRMWKKWGSTKYGRFLCPIFDTSRTLIPGADKLPVLMLQCPAAYIIEDFMFNQKQNIQLVKYFGPIVVKSALAEMQANDIGLGNKFDSDLFYAFLSGYTKSKSTVEEYMDKKDACKDIRTPEQKKNLYDLLEFIKKSDLLWDFRPDNIGFLGGKLVIVDYSDEKSIGSAGERS